jgi:hypothetical protein
MSINLLSGNELLVLLQLKQMTPKYGYGVRFGQKFGASILPMGKKMVGSILNSFVDIGIVDLKFESRSFPVGKDTFNNDPRVYVVRDWDWVNEMKEDYYNEAAEQGIGIVEYLQKIRKKRCGRPKKTTECGSK